MNKETTWVHCPVCGNKMSRTYRRWMWITRVLRHENKADKDICP